MAQGRRLNSSRLGRLSVLGRLAGGLAGGAIGEGVRQISRGQRPAFGQMLLTESNARRLAERLAELRGAAMKVGQLLSMDSGQLLPPEVSEVLDRLRADADPMPLGQVADVLRDAWGDGWETQFERFFFTPLAAASIGQVHEARLKDGRRLAIKLQYPGVRRSIDADVDNVGSLLRLFRVMPEGMDVEPLLAEAKRQLHHEADYRQEAAALRRFADRLGDDPRYCIPAVVDELSSDAVLVMAFLDGAPIESLSNAPAALRDRVAGTILELALREVFEWGLVQTDPNFANYLYDADSDRVQLLDFGATRDYSGERQLDLVRLMQACVHGSDDDVGAMAVKVGYLADDEPRHYRASIVGLLRIATEPARHAGDYRFGDPGLAQRMREQLVQLRLQQKYARLPPVDLLYLHRKLGGLYLLLARLKARLPVGKQLATRLAGCETTAAATA